jgi:capsular polysaccharide export protein
MRAERCAKQHAVPCWRLEDGFLRSFGTGHRFPALSLVVDDAGMYYDCSGPSALENLLATDVDVLAGIGQQVKLARQLILKNRLSKYNHAPMLEPACLRADDAQRVLVVDQTRGDLSVRWGGAHAQTFTAMLEAALAENPLATIYVKTHPEVSAGLKSGYLTQLQDDDRTVVLREAINPLSLIERMDRVYVVTSTMGFEALLAGKPVRVFGMPWYAGWGATEDEQTCARRTRLRTVDELFAAAYFHYARYLNPVTHARGTIFDVIDWLVLQRQIMSRYSGRMVCVGLRRWKAVNVKPLLSLEPHKVIFASSLDAANRLNIQPHDCLVHWGRQAPAGLPELAQGASARVLQMEDGFVRSVGLGSDLIRPLSLALDELGIYFDATQASALEQCLGTTAFTAELLSRARGVRDFIVTHGITKYNLEPRGTARWPSLGKPVLLVPGQVEDDASIRYGCPGIATNLDLLKAARQAHPDAFIVYKPHPDVLSSNRKGKLVLSQALLWADHVETTWSVVSCIDACDEVHTMTSLTGFDALLRGKKVVTYGLPFYAGWGLTHDRVKGAAALDRRTRQLTLDELVAAVLLLYPLYWDWELKGYTTCEAVLHRIVEVRHALEIRGDLDKLRLGFVRRQWRKLGIVLRAFVAL